jgi:hypothetical protein
MCGHLCRPFYYSVEPTSFDDPPDRSTATSASGMLTAQPPLSALEKETSVVGVEACMWSEWVDGSNFAGRFWPRAAAIAERGWSPKDTVSIDDFRRRIHQLSCELKRRSLPAEPVVHGGRFFYENGTVCAAQRQPQVLGPPEDGCLPRFSSCATHASKPTR